VPGLRLRGQRRFGRDGRRRRTLAVLRTVGVDLGGTKLLGIVLDDDGRIAAEARLPTPSGADAVVDAIAEVVGVLGASGMPVGVGAPGLIDHQGTLRFAPNLPGVVEVPLRALLWTRLGVPVVIENDATAACWAEREVGAAVGADDVVVVTLGTGIGGGIVSGGRLQHGANGFAGEIGHMVIDPNGPPCPCGKRGCWERFASGSGLGRMAAEQGLGERGEDVTAAALAGDARAQKLLAEFGWWVALGLVNLAYILDCSLFVLGGGLVEAGDLLLDPVRAAFTALLAGSAHRPPVALAPAVLGSNAGAIGAALLARSARAG
jgi:glucokinase